MTIKEMVPTAAAILIVLAGVTLQSGCQIAAKTDGGDKDSTYGYNLDVNGCSTGEQKFTSKSSYCSGLADEALNKGCAKSDRQEMYTRECGQWPSSTITGPGGNGAPLAPDIERLIDKRLTGPAVARSGEFFAAALTLKKDRTYILEMSRGPSSSVDPSRGTSIESGWKANGINIQLLGSGDASAGTFNSAPGVTLTAGIPGASDSVTFILNAR